jgi:hypothetical protein
MNEMQTVGNSTSLQNCRQFIDSTDHGRQLQSASNFDAGSAFTGETFPGPTLQSL